MKKVITCELKGKVATPENKKANSDVLTTTVESQASFGGFQGESGVMIGGQAVQAMTMDSSADISVLNALAAGIAIKRDQIRLSLQNYNVDLDNKATKAGNENIALPEEIEEHDPAKQSMLGAKVTGTTFILNTQPASTSSNEDVRTQTVNEPVNNLVTPPVVIQHNLSSSFQTAPVLHSDPPIQTLNYVINPTPPVIVPPEPPIFTDGNDVVDFNNVSMRRFSGDALGGDDTIMLPSNPANSNRVGYVVGNMFFAGEGNDTVTGGELNDLIGGGAGNDTIDGGGGSNILLGGEGNDNFIMSTPVATNLVRGGDGVNTIDFSQLPSEGVRVFLNNNQFNSDTNQLQGAIFDVTNVIGTQQSDLLIGAETDDDLKGLGGNDVIDGLGGTNNLEGGEGDDTFLVRNAVAINNIDGGTGDNRVDFSDVPTEGVQVDLGAGTFRTETNNLHGTIANISTVRGTLQNDSLKGGDGNDNLQGYFGNDNLSGGAGINQLDGGDGSDTFIVDAPIAETNIYGGPNSDTGTDAVFFNGLSEGVTVNLVTGEYHSDSGNAHGTIAEIEMITATDYADHLIGSARAETLLGGAGNDIIEGGAGSNILDGGADDDTFLMTSGSSSDQIDGGDGTDTIDFSTQSEAVTVDLSANTFASVSSNVMGNLYNVENVIGTNFNDTLIGGAANETLLGGDGADDISGGEGTNLLRGEAGDDTFGFTSVSAVDTVEGGIGSDTADFSALTSAVNVDLSVNLGSFASDTLSGSLSSVEKIIATQFADTLTTGTGITNVDAGQGNDTINLSTVTAATTTDLDGGIGNDTADFSTLSQAVNVDLANGIFSSGILNGSVTSIETIIGSAHADTITGSLNDETLSGGAGNDTIDGGAGSNDLYGDAGDDTFLMTAASGSNDVFGGTEIDTVNFSTQTQGVTVNLAAGTFNTDNSSLTGNLNSIEKVIGTDFADTLTGSAADETLSGGAGVDTIDGGAGINVLNGNDGDDQFTLLSVNATNTIDGGVGTDTADFSGLTSYVEVDLSGDPGTFISGNLNGTTTSVENFIGSIFADHFVSGNHNSTFEGGIGSDSFEINSATSNVTVNIDGGADIDGVDFSSLTAGVTVHLDTGTYSSGNVSGSITGVEDVNGSIFADDMTGGVNSETLVGNDGGDTLRGGGGSDYIDGGAGDDTLYGDAGQDNLVGGEGNDILVFEDDMTAGSMNGGVGEDTVRFVGSVTNFDFVASPVNPFTDIEVIDLGVSDIGRVISVNSTVIDSWTTANNTNEADTRIAGDSSDIVRFQLDEGLYQNYGAIGPHAGFDTWRLTNDTEVEIQQGIQVQFYYSSPPVLFDPNHNTVDFNSTILVPDGSYVNDAQGGNDVVTLPFDLTAANRVGYIAGTVFFGSAGDDTITGGTLNDVIEGGLDNDTLYGGAGNDTLSGNEGDDTINGDAGNDTIDGGTGTNTLNGGADNDTFILIDPAHNHIDGDTGVNTADFSGVVSQGVTVDLANNSYTSDNSQIYGDIANVTRIIGSNQADHLFGGSASDVFFGGAGNDILEGGAGSNELYGEGGDDIFLVNAQTSVTNNVIDGGADFDTVDFSAVTQGVSVNPSAVYISNNLVGSLTRIERVIGSGFSDTFAMTPLAIATAYTLVGGAGADTIDFGSMNSAVTVNANGTFSATNLTGSISGVETIIGSAFADFLNGDIGDDTINGGDGSDTINGGIGTNILNGGNDADTFLMTAITATTNNTIIGGAGNDTGDFSGLTSALTLNADGTFSALNLTGSVNSVETIIGTTFADFLTGGAGDDIIQGGDGADTIDGGAGTNILMGGNDSDTFVMKSVATATNSTIDGGAANDTADFSQMGQAVTVNADTFTSTNLTGSLTSVEIINGSDFVDQFTTGSNSRTLSGGAGNDVFNLNSATAIFNIDGGADSDTANFTTLTQAVNVDLSAGTFVSGTLNGTLTSVETINGSDHADIFTTGAGTRTLSGGAGNDTFNLTQAAGTANIDGGTDSDTANFTTLTQAVNVDLSAGTFVSGTLNGTLTSVETINGSAQADIFTTGAGTRTITGGAGNDTFNLTQAAATANIDGGTDSDTANFTTLTQAVNVDLSTGTFVSGTLNGTLTSVETINGSAQADIFTTGAGTRTITGGAGNDTFNLTQAAGTANIDGGTDSDTANFTTLTQAVNVDLSAGTFVSGTLNGTLTSVETINGSAQADIFTTGAGTRTITGGAGNDTFNLTQAAATANIDGGTDSDTANFTTLTQAVNVDLSTGTFVSGTLNGTLTSVETINGSDHADIFTTGAGTRTLSGGAGADTFYINSANATLNIDGGTGNSIDTANFSALSTALTLNADGTFVSNTLSGSITNIETIIGTAFNDVLNGSAASETISGGADIDVINGGAGTNFLNGDAGNDIFMMTTGTAVTNINGGNDADTVDFSGLTTEGVKVELDVGTYHSDVIAMTGNLNGTITGVEKVIGTTFTDILTGSSNADHLIGGAGSDILTGGAGNDILEGGDQNDNLFGGADQDTMIGGAGDDTLVYEADMVANALDGGSGIDTVQFAASETNLDLVAAPVNPFKDIEVVDLDQFVARTLSINSTVIDNWTTANNVNLADTRIAGNANDIVRFEQDEGTYTNIGTSSQNAGFNTWILYDRLGVVVNNTEVDIQQNVQIQFYYTNIPTIFSNGVDTVDFNNSFQAPNNSYATNTDALSGNDVVILPNTLNEALRVGYVPGVSEFHGGAGNDTITGGALADIIYGDADNDTINSGDGDDIVYGGQGNDILNGGTGTNLLFGDGGLDTFMITATSGVTTIDGGDAGTNILNFSGMTQGVTFNLLTDTTGNFSSGAISGSFINVSSYVFSNYDDIITGSAFSDTLSGGDGNDIIDGFIGANTLNGNAGNDIFKISTVFVSSHTIDGGTDNDTIDFSGYGSGVTINANGTFSGFNMTGVYTSIETIIGSNTSDTINAANGQTIYGGSGNDIISGPTANGLTFYGGSGNDTLTGGTGNDIINGDEDDDTIFGAAGNNTLNGGLGNDTFQIAGGGFNDTIDGGDGFDTIDFSGRPQGVTVDGAAFTTGFGGGTRINVEGIIGTGFNDFLTGDAGDEIINGGSGDDTINGYSGNNILSGDANNDTFIMTSVTATNIINGGADIDTINFSGLTLAGVTFDMNNQTFVSGSLSGSYTSVESFVFSNLADTIIGVGNNIIATLGGDDYININGGTHTIDGGEGNDTFQFDGDIVSSSTIIGGNGTDTLDFSALPQQAMQVDLTNGFFGGTSMAGTISGIENVIGTIFSDSLTGDIQSNVLMGGGGDDTINGMGGGDIINGGTGTNSLIGGDGNDTFQLNSTTGVNTLNGGTGVDTLDFSGMSQGVTVNYLTGTFASNDNAMTGTITGALVNAASVENVIGTDYNDVIYGGGFIDQTFNGGGGDDRFILYSDGGADTIDGGTGSNTIDFSTLADVPVTINLATGTFSASFDSLHGTVTNVHTVIGSNFADNITGSSGNDTLIGGIGIDNLFGGDGDDVLYYQNDTGFQKLNGGNGEDTMVLANTSLTISTNNSVNPLINIEIFDLGTGDAARTISITDTTVRDVWGANTVRITGDSADTVQLSSTTTTYHDTGASLLHPGFDTWVGTSGSEIDIQQGITVIS